MPSTTHLVLVACALVVIGSAIYLLAPVLRPRRVTLDLRVPPRPRMRPLRPPVLAPEVPIRVSMRETVIAPEVPVRLSLRETVPYLEPPRFAREADVDEMAATLPEAYASYEVAPRRRR